MLVHTGCLPTHLTALPTGAAVATGTLLLGNDAQYHAATVTAIQEEGAAVQAAPTFLNFVGAGVTAAVSGAGATVTIPQSFTPVQDEGVVVQATPTALNFVGAGVTATNSAGVATVTIPQSFTPVQDEGVVVQVTPTFLNFTGSSVTATANGTGADITIVSGSLPIQDEGVVVQATPTAINFVGAGVTATNSAGVATVTIPQSFLPIQEEGVAVQAAPTFLNFIGSGVTAAASGAGATVTIVGASGPVQEEGVQVVASPTFTNFAGTALTATASGAGALVTIDPYATNTIAQAGTSVRDIITAANLFARENITAQVGLSNDVTAIPAPTADLSNWGTNLLGERLHYMPGIGWRIVANFFGFTLAAYGAVPANTLDASLNITAPRAGRLTVSAYISALMGGAPGAPKILAVFINKGAIRFANSGEASANNALDANAKGTFTVAAGDIINITYFNSSAAGVGSTLYSYQYES